MSALPRSADAFFLAWRALRSEPWRSSVMVVGATVALLLPLFTHLVADRVETGLLARARATPVVIGAKGNEFDLTMSSLYFRGQVSETLRYGDRSRIEEAALGVVAPLDVRFTSDGAPIVGTTPEYFEARALRFAAGRRPALLGEVAAGSALAASRRLEVGDFVRSDLRNLYDLAGSYPLVLEVVGLLEPTGRADDDVLFAGLATTWAIDGRLHGHDEVNLADVVRPESEDAAARSDEHEADNLEATAALFLFQRIDDTNRGSFHLHGDRERAPVTSLLVFPRDERARDLVLAEYALDERLQAVQPVDVIETVLAIVVRMARVLDAYFLLVALSTGAFLTLVVALSMRLRRSEIELMRRVGASRGTVVLVVGLEIATIVVAAGALASLLSWLGAAWLDTAWLDTAWIDTAWIDTRTG